MIMKGGDMKKGIITLVFIITVLVSCESEPRGNFNRETFNRERGLWLEQDIRNYSFWLYEGSNAVKRNTVMYIKEGVLFYIWLEGRDEGFFLTNVAIGMNEDGTYIPPIFGETIADIYTEIERFMNQAGRRDTVEIRYDSEWHYPVYFMIEEPMADKDVLTRRYSFQTVKIDKFTIDPKYPTK